jgi:hypothetical protein
VIATPPIARKLSARGTDKSTLLGNLLGFPECARTGTEGHKAIDIDLWDSDEE